MFGKRKITIASDLHERAAQFAETVGYPSVDDLVRHLLERELSSLDGAKDEEDVKKRLRGLGYIE